jgi:putative glutathione S-transferase
MGLLVKGQWQNDWYDTDGNAGEFVRQGSQYRNLVTADGGAASAQAMANRYQLIVSLACPWAHRTLIFRAVKKLQAVIGVTVVSPKMLEQGWEFTEESPPPIAGIKYLYQLYSKVDSNYSGRVTVPVLYDKQQNTIINNESADIIRILNSAFNQFTEVRTDYYPAELREEINGVNDYIYDNINNGVYKTGFATTQSAYERNYQALFVALDTVEQRLSNHRYLIDNRLTEADWRLFTTLIRFDHVYHGHFKANRQRLEDFPNLSQYLRDLYQTPGVADTVNFDHIKTHYYYSHDRINPNRIVPAGPAIDYYRAHNRERFAR